MKRKRADQTDPGRPGLPKPGFFNLRTPIVVLFCALVGCSVLSVTLLGFLSPQTGSRNSERTLSFAERVSYQRSIEEVYWRHRSWPNDHPKPPLDSVMSETQLDKKVADYLRKSQALEDYLQRPITAEQLQAEMDRMAVNTRHPQILRELFEALGNDPFVVAECLARPVAAERLLVRLDEREKVGDTSKQSRFAHAGMKVHVSTAERRRQNYTLPQIAGPFAGCTENTWTTTSVNNAPSARVAAAVWTGSEMIVWGGFGGTYLNTGARYDPGTDSWTAISTMNAPAPRSGNTAVWTGSEMIVWGGDDGLTVNTGGRYNPATDTWTPTDTTSAPLGRIFHTAVWDGSEMIVWGGWNEVELRTGARYNPGTDSWTATSITDAPDARFDHTAVWDGSEMIVWGGWNGSNAFNTGGRYDPGTDGWIAITTTNAPTARYDHTAIWTGNEMIVWGGKNGGDNFATGGKYNPSADDWAATSTINAPVGRFGHTAVWTGSDMIVWGGTNMLEQFNTGGRYKPGTDNWMATTTSNAPERRTSHTAVWSGSEMIVWGGFNDFGPFYLNTGGKYCAPPDATPTPTATSSPTATATVTPRVTPTPRVRPTPVPRP